MSSARPTIDTVLDATLRRGVHVDFGFLAAQTFNDRELQRELLQLFIDQARRLVPALSGMTPDEQAVVAHRLKGSCQGIGAWPAAEAVQRYEDAAPQDRAALQAELVAAFAAAEDAALAHLQAT